MAIKKLRPSYNYLDERIAQLRQVVPEAFADGKINWPTLQEVLRHFLEDDGAEHFGLSWPGKREARHMAGQPSKGSLKPMFGEGLNEEGTHHVFVEGENLEVLKLFQKSYSGRARVIYIDPPYNTGNDFIFEDDFAEPLERYLRRTGQKGESGDLLVTNTRADGRFHSNWLSMMYPRLQLARNLLSDDGVLFVSIGETEVHHLRMVLTEIFGEENFVATIVWQKSKRGDSKLIAQIHEYILVAVKNKQTVLDSGIWRKKKEGVDEVLVFYSSLRQAFGDDHDAISNAMSEWYKGLQSSDARRAHEHYRWSDARGLYFAADFAGPDDGRKSRPRYDIIHPVTGKPCKKPSTGWRWDEERTKKALGVDPPLVHFGPDETTIPCRKTYLHENDSEPFFSVFYRDGRAATLELEQLVGRGLLDFPKNVDVLKELITLVGDKEAVVLDFFAGSCSTAQAVLELNAEDRGNRRFIMVQLPEITGNADFPTIADVGKERIRQVITNLQATNERAKVPVNNNLDLGFRVFTLTASNFKEWEDYDGEETNQLEGLWS